MFSWIFDLVVCQNQPTENVYFVEQLKSWSTIIHVIHKKWYPPKTNESTVNHNACGMKVENGSIFL